jgi:hypothetical protein
MSLNESTRTLRTRPRWALLALVLAAIGAGTAWAQQPLRNYPICMNEFAEWNVNGGQFASHSAQIQVTVKLLCVQPPGGDNDCPFCIAYDFQVLKGGVWTPYAPGQTGTVIVPCDSWDRESWTNTFNGTIGIGTYRCSAALYFGSCSDSGHVQEMHQYYPFSITY